MLEGGKKMYNRNKGLGEEERAVLGMMPKYQREEIFREYSPNKMYKSRDLVKRFCNMCGTICG